MPVRMEWHGERAEAEIDAAITRGIDAGLEPIAETSQDRVLVEWGDLWRSQRTSVAGNVGAVTYTDSKAVGAHENLAVTPQKPGTRAKFLESALEDRKDDALRAIADKLRDAL